MFTASLEQRFVLGCLIMHERSLIARLMMHRSVCMFMHQRSLIARFKRFSQALQRS